MFGNKGCVCAAVWSALLQPHSHLHGNAGNGERPRDLQLQKWKRPKLERTNWTLSPSFPLTNSNTPNQAHTFYLHASLPSRAVWSHTPSRDPDFYTVRSLCPAINHHPPSLSADERLMGWGACRGEKGKNASLPCSAMLSFLFLLCQTSEQPPLPFCFAQTLPTDCFVLYSGLLMLLRCIIHTASDSCFRLVPPG